MADRLSVRQRIAALNETTRLRNAAESRPQAPPTPKPVRGKAASSTPTQPGFQRVTVRRMPHQAAPAKLTVAQQRWQQATTQVVTANRAVNAWQASPPRLACGEPLDDNTPDGVTRSRMVRGVTRPDRPQTALEDQIRSTDYVVAVGKTMQLTQTWLRAATSAARNAALLDIYKMGFPGAEALPAEYAALCGTEEGPTKGEVDPALVGRFLDRVLDAIWALPDQPDTRDRGHCVEEGFRTCWAGIKRAGEVCWHSEATQSLLGAKRAYTMGLLSSGIGVYRANEGQINDILGDPGDADLRKTLADIFGAGMWRADNLYRTGAFHGVREMTRAAAGNFTASIFGESIEATGLAVAAHLSETVEAEISWREWGIFGAVAAGLGVAGFVGHRLSYMCGRGQYLGDLDVGKTPQKKTELVVEQPHAEAQDAGETLASLLRKLEAAWRPPAEDGDAPVLRPLWDPEKSDMASDAAGISQEVSQRVLVRCNRLMSDLCGLVDVYGIATTGAPEAAAEAAAILRGFVGVPPTTSLDEVLNRAVSMISERHESMSENRFCHYAQSCLTSEWFKGCWFRTIEGYSQGSIAHSFEFLTQRLGQIENELRAPPPSADAPDGGQQQEQAQAEVQPQAQPRTAEERNRLRRGLLAGVLGGIDVAESWYREDCGPAIVTNWDRVMEIAGHIPAVAGEQAVLALAGMAGLKVAGEELGSSFVESGTVCLTLSAAGVATSLTEAVVRRIFYASGAASSQLRLDATLTEESSTDDVEAGRMQAAWDAMGACVRRCHLPRLGCLTGDSQQRVVDQQPAEQPANLVWDDGDLPAQPQPQRQPQLPAVEDDSV